MAENTDHHPNPPTQKQPAFHFSTKVTHEEDQPKPEPYFSTKVTHEEGELKPEPKVDHQHGPPPPQQQKNKHTRAAVAAKRRLQAMAVTRIRSVLTALNINKGSMSNGGPLGAKIIGTLFGYRRGHVHFVFQKAHNSNPVFLVELATPITSLVRELASGLVRIALECDKEDKKGVRLLEEQVWRTYCNGKKCGYANKRECGPKEMKILKAVEPISMGAGVLPGFNGSGSCPDGELMYMRAQFERVVGSRDSEAFYMMNPDSNGAPELSIYLLRV